MEMSNHSRTVVGKRKLHLREEQPEGTSILSNCTFNDVSSDTWFVIVPFCGGQLRRFGVTFD